MFHIFEYLKIFAASVCSVLPAVTAVSTHGKLLLCTMKGSYFFKAASAACRRDSF